MKKNVLLIVLLSAFYLFSYAQSITVLPGESSALNYTKVFTGNGFDGGTVCYFNQGKGMLTIGIEVQKDGFATWPTNKIAIKYNGQWHQLFEIWTGAPNTFTASSIWNWAQFASPPTTLNSTYNTLPTNAALVKTTEVKTFGGTGSSVYLFNLGDLKRYDGQYLAKSGDVTKRVKISDYYNYDLQTAPYSSAYNYPVSDPAQSSGEQAVFFNNNTGVGYLKGHADQTIGNLPGVGSFQQSPGRGVVYINLVNLPPEMLESNGFRVHLYQNANTANDRIYEWVYNQSPNFMTNAPTSLAATTDLCGKTTLTWGNSTNPLPTDGQISAVKTAIFRNGTYIGIVNFGTTTFNDATAVQDVEYNYSVRHVAFSESGKTYYRTPLTAAVKGSKLKSPDQPINPTATIDDCTGKITVSWGYNGSNPKYFRIDRATSATGTFTTISSTIAGSSRSYDNTGLTRGQNYYYRIYAINKCGVLSTAYAATNGISMANPGIATNVSVTLSTAKDTAIVSWKDVANNESKYEVHRQDDQGNLIIYAVNKTDGSGTTITFRDDGISACKSFTYSIFSFNNCAQSGLQSLVDTTGIIPPPNLNASFTAAKKLVGSKGYFNNRIELSWSNDNGQNLDLFKIYRKTLGSSVDSTLIGTANQGSGFYVDNTGDAGVFYKYTIVGIKYCNGGEILSNTSEDIAFRSPTGIVNGHIQYTGGVAVKNVKVTAEPVSAAVGNSILLNGTNSIDIPNNLTNVGVGDTLAVEAWFRSTASTPTTQKIASKAGSYGLQLNYTSNKAEFSITLSSGFKTVSYPFINGVTQVQTATISKDSSRATLSAASSFVKGDYIRFGTADSNPAFLVDSVNSLGKYVLIKGVFTNANYSGVIQKLTKGQALAGNIGLNTYYHICGSYDGTYVKLFVNGITVDSTAATGTIIQTTNPLKFGKGFKGNLDEIRVWNRTRTNVEVNRDAAIMKSGDEGGIVVLLHADEGATQFAFDISKTGLTYNGNNATFNPTSSVAWSSIIPTKSQLSYAGFTNINGDYTVSGVRYTGIGFNYKITPYLNLGGVHQFTPGNKVLFLGDGANIQNGIDFLDESSFRVTGNVRYDNSSCATKGLNVFIDGAAVIAAGLPVETDVNGFFDVRVPIGNHVVTVAKKDHVMSEGRFPPTGTHDFQANILGIQFTDSTLVKVTGRAIGGLREAQYIRGLGKSKNNIGQAQIIFTSLQGNGCFKDTVITADTTGEYTKFLPPLKYNVEIEIPSNPIINFGIQSVLNLDVIPKLITDYDTISYDSITKFYVIDSISYNKALDFVHRVNPKIIVTNFSDHNKEFIGMEELVYTPFGGTAITRNLRTNPFPWPVFSAKDTAGYRCHIQVYEEYKNFQTNKIDSVPTTDGTLSVNNGMIKMGVTGVDMKNVNTTLDSLSDFFYKFKVNNPNFLTNTSIPELSFTSKLDIYLTRPDGSIISWLPDNFSGTGSAAFNAANDKIYRGYALGIKADGLQFLTAGPQIPDYILRDPPGSNSSATREVGTTKTSEHTWSANLGGSAGTEDNIFLGAKFNIGLGLSTSTEIENNNTIGFKASFSGGTSGSGSSTITNTQAWSTNANNELPGNGSDLYIGKSKNVSFGISETLKIVPDSLCTKIECLGSPFFGYSFAKSYGLTIVPGGYGTQFIFSENHIVNYLIPLLENLRSVMLQSNSKYTSHLPIGDANYGLNNDDPRVKTSLPQLTSDETIEYMLRLPDSSSFDIIPHKNGSSHTENFMLPSAAQKKVWDVLANLEKADFSVMDGLSYKYKAANRQDSLTGDSVRWINNQIRHWKQSVMLNEWEKVNISNVTIKTRLKERELSELYKKYKTPLVLFYLTAATSGAITGIGALAAVVTPVPGSAIVAGVGFGIGSAAGMIAAELEESVAKYNNAKTLIIAKYDQTSTNYSISGGNVFSSSLTHESATSFSRSLEYGMSTSLDFEIKGKVSNTGVGFKKSIGMDFKSSRDWGTSSSSSETVSFTLDDPDQGDFFSVDAYPSLLGWGPIFKLKPGGATQCPHEDQVLTTYYLDKPSNSGSNSNYPFVELSARTFQMDKPTIDVTPSILTNVPTTGKAVFNLTINNESEVNDDMTYRVEVISTSNPFGAIIKIDGIAPFSNVTIPGNASVNKVLTVEKGGGPIYNYDSLIVIVHSICQYEAGTADQVDIVDSVYISAHFLPTCTNANFIKPENQWVLNNSFKDTMQISIFDYDINFFDLKNIRLDYKPSAQSTWSSLETFHKDTSGMGGMALPIPTNASFTLWDWATEQFVDGPYDLRLVSHCTLADKVSVIHSGIMDRINPHPFGTPSPGDGILSPNDDISIQFNEPVDLGSINSFNFDIRGVLNGAEIRHDASLFFDGVNDNVKIANGLGLNNSATIEMWIKRLNLNTSEVFFSQGINNNQTFELGFNSVNQLTVKIADKTYVTTAATAVISDNLWHHVALSYDKINSSVEYFIDGALEGNSSLIADYTEGGAIYLGKSANSNVTFSGYIHELRIWNKPTTQSDLIPRITRSLSGQEFGLVGVWSMDEARGVIANDNARNRHGIIDGANWSIFPSGQVMNFDGVNSNLEYNTSQMAFSKEMDFTIEFWYNANTQADSACLFSNGKGNTNLTWAVYTDTTGKLFVKNNNINMEAISTNTFDGTWHHFAIVVSRTANTSFYLDGNLTTSTPSGVLGEFGSSKAFVGSRGFYTGSLLNNDQYFNGKIDEFRLWNLSRKREQINRDLVNRLNGDEYGLQLYLPFEKYISVLNVATLVPALNNVVNDSLSIIGGAAAYDGTNVPNIKLPRPISSIPFTFSVNSDKIIITPNVAPAQIENVTLDITTEGISDLQGNKMQSPKTWIAYIDKNQVVWEDLDKNISINLEDTLTFFTNILNKGGQLKNYTISNIPSWLQVSPTTGTIVPNSLKGVSFSVVQGVNIGTYEQDIYLTTDFGYNEALHIKLKVTKQSPNWTVDPNAFQYAMSVIGQIKVDGIISIDPEDKLVALVNGEVRGVVNLQYYSQYDAYLAFMDVYSNTVSGDTLQFYVWDASAGKTHVEVTPDLLFVDGNLYGMPNAPQIFNAINIISQPIEVYNGWNWISFNLNSPNKDKVNKLLNNINKSAVNGNIMKSISKFDQYSNTIGWVGSITAAGGVNNRSMYKLNINGNDTIDYYGSKITPSNVKIPIDSGWNWIGIVALKNVSVANAFGNYNVNHGDLLRGQSSFAVYDSILGWVGSLTFMTPNDGYMLKSSKSDTLIYPNTGLFAAKMKFIDIQEELNVSANLNPHKYQYNMSMIVKANICENNLKAYTLQAYYGKELRGIATTNNGMFFLTLYGSGAAEDFTFKIMDVNGSVYEMNEEITFAANKVMGTSNNPYPLSSVALDIVDCDELQSNTATSIANLTRNSNDMVIVSPTLFDTYLNFNFTLNESFKVKIELYDITGKRVAAINNVIRDAGNSTYQWDLSNLSSNLSAGAYLVKIQLGDQYLITNKVIKTNR